MKVKLKELIRAMPAMGQFSQEKLPAKAAYRVAKLVRKMNGEMEDYEKARTGMVKKHGEQVPGPEGQAPGWRVKPENLEAFTREMESTLEEESELEGCIEIAWADIEGLTLSPAVLADLHLFIEAPKE